MKKTLAIGSAVIGFVMLVSGAVMAAATVPAGKETVKIDVIPGDKGAVEFPHAKHVTTFKKVGGKAIVCKDCHHTLKADEPTATDAAQACQTCHVLDTPKTVDGKTAPVLATMKEGKADLKSVIFHERCKDGCHKEMKAEGKNITGCNTCHKK